jgi:hypothetical protein
MRNIMKSRVEQPGNRLRSTVGLERRGSHPPGDHQSIGAAALTYFGLTLLPLLVVIVLYALGVIG